MSNNANADETDLEWNTDWVTSNSCSEDITRVVDFNLSLKKYVDNVNQDAQTWTTAINKDKNTTFTYVIRVKNEGSASTTNTTTVTDNWVNWIELVSASSADFTCNVNAWKLTCTSNKVVSSWARFSDIIVTARTTGQTWTFENVATVSNPDEVWLITDNTDPANVRVEEDPVTCDNSTVTKITGEFNKFKVTCEWSSNSKKIKAVVRYLGVEQELSIWSWNILEMNFVLPSMITNYTVDCYVSNEENPTTNDWYTSEQNCHNTWELSPVFDLTIKKFVDDLNHDADTSAEAVSKNQNSNFTYKIRVQNRWPAKATGETKIIDNWAVLDWTWAWSIELLSATWTNWACTVTSWKLECKTNEEVESGQYFEVITVMTKTSTDSEWVFKNTAEVSNPNEPNEYRNDNTDPANVEVNIINSEFDLSLKKYVDNTNTDANTNPISKNNNTEFDYIISVKNEWEWDTSWETKVIDNWVNWIELLSATWIDWTCNITSWKLECINIKTYSSDVLLPVITVKAKTTSSTWTFTNTATVSNPDEKDNSESNNSDIAKIKVWWGGWNWSSNWGWWDTEACETLTASVVWDKISATCNVNQNAWINIRFYLNWTEVDRIANTSPYNTFTWLSKTLDSEKVYNVKCFVWARETTPMSCQKTLCIDTNSDWSCNGGWNWSSNWGWNWWGNWGWNSNAQCSNIHTAVNLNASSVIVACNANKNTKFKVKTYEYNTLTSSYELKNTVTSTNSNTTYNRVINIDNTKDYKFECLTDDESVASNICTQEIDSTSFSTNVCWNGILEVNESCDSGSSINWTSDSLCSLNCTIKDPDATSTQPWGTSTDKFTITWIGWEKIWQGVAVFEDGNRIKFTNNSEEIINFWNSKLCINNEVPNSWEYQSYHSEPAFVINVDSAICTDSAIGMLSPGEFKILPYNKIKNILWGSLPDSTPIVWYLHTYVSWSGATIVLSRLKYVQVIDSVGSWSANAYVANNAGWANIDSTISNVRWTSELREGNYTGTTVWTDISSDWAWNTSDDTVVRTRYTNTTSTISRNTSSNSALWSSITLNSWTELLNITKSDDDNNVLVVNNWLLINWNITLESSIKTIIIENWDLVINWNIKYSSWDEDSSYAFIVKNWDIIIKDTVETIAWRYLVMNWWKAKWSITSTIPLLIMWWFYANSTELINSRTYARWNNSYDSLSTWVITMQDNRPLPPTFKEDYNRYRQSRVSN